MPSPLASANTYLRVLQLWFYVLTAIFSKPLPGTDKVLDPKCNLTAVDKRNAWPWWIRHPGSDWILRGYYEPLCLLCLGSLSKYLLSEKKFAKDIEAIGVASVYPNFNSQVVLLILNVCWMVHPFLTNPLVGQWYQPPHVHPAHFSVPR